jgi:hypothetical protein
VTGSDFLRIAKCIVMASHSSRQPRSASSNAHCCDVRSEPVDRAPSTTVNLRKRREKVAAHYKLSHSGCIRAYHTDSANWAVPEAGRQYKNCNLAIDRLKYSKPFSSPPAARLFQKLTQFSSCGATLFGCLSL